MSRKIYGPTYSEMLHPRTIDPKVRADALEMKTKDPLDPVNLYNISWRDENDRLYAEIIPEALTGVETPIAVLYAKDFPTGSHKVGATYSVLLEKQLSGEVDPAIHTLVWPSTGNYGIGGAWVGCRMKFDRQKLDYIMEGTVEARKRWHHLKYYTWVEQQGKTIEELNAQKSREWWQAQRYRIEEYRAATARNQKAVNAV